MLAFGPDHSRHLGLHHAPHDLQPHRGRQGQQPVLCYEHVPERDLHGFRKPGLQTVDSTVLFPNHYAVIG